MSPLARALGWVFTFLAMAPLLSACTHVPELGGFATLHAQPPSAAPISAAPHDAELTLNHLQLKGSHNSYHQAPRLALARGWRYSHQPIATQLEKQGVRQLELDVRYIGGKVVVGHLPLIDGRSSCQTLKGCLEQLRGWSTEHPSHLPVFVFLEIKEDVAPSNLENHLNVLDQTITSVFPRQSLLIPEQVAGSARSMREALRTRGWPTVAESRGKVAFVMFGPDRHVRAYAANRPRLEGRVMFAAGDPSMPWAAVCNYDDPVHQADQIARALREGMLVRTRADADLKHDVRRRNAALASGAHFIGSDFVDPRQNWVELGERAPVRCNPRLAPERCTSAALAEVEQPRWAGLGVPKTPVTVD